jgi:hemoglobin-like flavoprotein
MTPEQVRLVRSAFQRVGHLPAMTGRFYPKLFDKDPTVRPMFTSDVAEQKIRFAEKLTEMVGAMGDLDELLAHPRALGARHAGYGVPAAHNCTLGRPSSTPSPASLTRRSTQPPPRPGSWRKT